MTKAWSISCEYLSHWRTAITLTNYSRGKKIFRKFHDVPPSNGSEEDPHSSGDDLRHQAGPVAHRPLTRSAIKPRLLFQEEIQARQREHDHEDDEEAVTDIEVPITNPRRKAYKVSEAVTSVTQETTPPPPKQVKRRKLTAPV